MEFCVGSRRWPLNVAEKWQRAAAVAALILPFITLQIAPDARRLAKGARTEWTAWRAASLIREGRSDEAISELIRVCDACEPRPSVIRGLAWAGAEDFPAQASVFFKDLEALGRAGRDERLMRAHLLLRLGDAEGAARIFEGMAAAHVEDPVFWRSWGAACLARGHQKEAVRAFRRVMQIVPHDSQAALALAGILSRSRAAADTEEAASLLLGQLRRAVGARFTREAHGIAAMIQHLPGLPERHRGEFARLLEGMPDPEIGHRLAAILHSYPSEPGAEEAARRRAALRDLIKHAATSDDAERLAMARCLQQQAEHALVLEWITPADATARDDMGDVRMRSLIALGLWREGARLLEEGRGVQVIRSAALAKALIVMRSGGQPRRVIESLLTQALAQAERDKTADELVAVAFAALDHDLSRVASRAFAGAVSASPRHGALVGELFSAARRAGEPASALVESLSVAKSLPDAPPEIRKRAAYVRLLSGSESEVTALEIVRLREARPDEAYLQFLDAFAHFRLGDYAGAAQVLLPLPRYRWHQGEIAVMAAILSAAGKTSQAAALLASLDTTHLFPEERRLIEGHPRGVLAEAFSGGGGLGRQ